MSEYYVIFARKLTKFPNITQNLPEKLTKCPNLHDIFPKMFFPILEGQLPQFPSPRLLRLCFSSFIHCILPLMVNKYFNKTKPRSFY